MELNNIKEAALVLGILAGIAINIVTVFILVRKFPFETRQMDSDTVEKAAKALQIYATALSNEKTSHIEEVTSLKKKHDDETKEAYEKIATLERKVDDLEEIVELIKSEQMETKRMLEIYVDGSQRLSGQVQSLGATPLWKPPINKEKK